MKSPRLLLATAAIAALSLAGSIATANACGTDGYSYAGIGAENFSNGISAVITPLGPFNIFNGDVAGWVGVGGPGEGPNGTDEWLQVGLSAFPGTYSEAYYEVTLPNQDPVEHTIMDYPPMGVPYRFTVLEDRPNYWRVWMNGQPVSPEIYLPQSHNSFMPVATAESWDGGYGGTCNNFLYTFNHVGVASQPGGLWHGLTNSYKITDPKTTVRRVGAAFIAAQGASSARTRLLSALLLLRP